VSDQNHVEESLAMNNVSATVLVGLAAWTVFLVILMEMLRFRLILTKAIAANGFKSDNSNLSPFMQRIARAHANCVENVPIFGILLIVALLTNRTGVTDLLAPWLLGARVVQSCFHLVSGNLLVTWLRFIAYAVQIAIAVYWLSALLVS
jgi:hypothetical protein